MKSLHQIFSKAKQFSILHRLQLAPEFKLILSVGPMKM